MRTVTFPRYLTIVLSLPASFAAAITSRVARLTARIDVNGLPYRHRLGAWESAASFRAQAIRAAAERRAAENDTP